MTRRSGELLWLCAELLLTVSSTYMYGYESYDKKHSGCLDLGIMGGDLGETGGTVPLKI